MNNITSLEFSFLNERLEIIDLLINYNFDINISKFYGETLLTYLLIKNRLKSAKHLINKGILINNQNDNNDSPLHIATKLHYTEIIELLINKLSDINLLNNQGYTSFEIGIFLIDTRAVFGGEIIFSSLFLLKVFFFNSIFGGVGLNILKKKKKKKKK